MLENEEIFKAITSSARDGIVLIDNFGKIIYWNKAAENIFYYSSVETLGKDLHLLIVPKQYRETYKRDFEEFINTGQGFFINKTIELHGLRKDGKIITIELSGSKIKLKGKWNAVAIIRDVSKRKLMEVKLKESKEEIKKLNRELEQKVEQKSKLLKETEENYRLFIEHAPLGLFSADVKGNIKIVNPSLLKMLGSPSIEATKQINLLTFPLLREAGISTAIEGCIEKRESLLKEISYKSKWEKEIYARLYLNPICDASNIVCGVQAIIEDITEWKFMEKELRESEEKYRLITENANDLIFIVNRNVITEYINEEVFIKLLGYTKDDAIGKPALNFIHSGDIEKTKELIRYGLKAGEGTAELRCIDKNGLFHWLEIRGKTFKSRDGETKAVFFARDITERKKAEDIIKEEIKKLKEIDQIRRDLITSVSHELKTPLMNISGGSELLLTLSKEKLGKEELDIIEIIEKGARRLRLLINNLLDISRLEYKKLKLEKNLNDLSKIMNECYNELKYLIKKRNIILSLELPEKLFLNIDKIRIEQVIFNILVNAIKNTPPKGKVKVLLQKSEKWAEFSVSDTGVGLTEEELKKIFSRFGKIERYGPDLEYLDIQGAGLGLYISKEIVKLHGGHIWAESEGRNKGSVFIIKLPIE